MASPLHNFKIVKTWKEIKKVVEYCKQTGYCSFDFETNAGSYIDKDAFPTIIGISFQPCSSYVIPLGHSESVFKDDYLPIIDYLGEHLITNEKVLKIAFNSAFENKWFLKYGWDYRGVVFDPMLMKHLLDEERPHGLGEIVNSVFPEFSHYKDDTEQLAKKHGWANIPLAELSVRNALDTDLTLRLALRFEKRLIKTGLYNLFRSLVMPNRWGLSHSEFRGIDIDVPYLHRLVEKYENLIKEADSEIRNMKVIRRYEKSRAKKRVKALIQSVQDEIAELSKQEGKERMIANREDKISRYLAGEFTSNKDKKIIEPLNFQSPQQLADLLFVSKKGFRFKPTKHTDSGNASTDEESLEALMSKDKTGFLPKFLNLRGISHLNNTYVQGMLKRLGPDNRIHGNFLVHGTVTGRLSSKDPNLQNIPRGTTAEDIKGMFIPPPGYLLLEVDYSQAELRLVAEMSGDKAMIEIFKRDYNIHVATACINNGGIDLYDKVKAILKDENHKDWFFWETEKKRAKTINFGILYGEGEDKLASQLGVTKEQAKKRIKDWFSNYPGVAAWIKNQHHTAHKKGYVKNVFGRKRRLPYAEYTKNQAKAEGVTGFWAEALRQSVNAPIQGGSSDLTQFASVIIRAEQFKGNLPSWENMFQIYTVHDSLGFIIKPEFIHGAVPKILDICNNPNTEKYFGFQMNQVRMKVSPEIGTTWKDLKDYDPWERYNKWVK